MSYFARIDKNNIVQSVHVVDDKELLNENGDEEEVFGAVYLGKVHGYGLTWVQTCINNSFRKVYAGVGYTYDKVNDVFIVPKPFASWTLDTNQDWQPPTAKPDDGEDYVWNEDTKSWDEWVLPV